VNPDRPLLSLCMIVKDEERNLPRCLRSVEGVVDQIVVVDTGSTDRTIQIARQMGAEVYTMRWEEDFAQARNYSLSKATGRWILCLDADEELVREDHEELLRLLKAQDADAYYLNGISYLGDKPEGDAFVHIAPRLWRHHPECRFERAVHEQILPAWQRLGYRTQLSRVRFKHYGYLAGACRDRNKIARNMAILRREAERRPHDSFTRFNLGVEYLRLGDYESALNEFQAAFRTLRSLRVGYGSLLVRNIALCLAKMERHHEAFLVLEDALEAYPDYTDLVFIKGLALQGMGRYSEAARAYRRCLELGDQPRGYVSQLGMGSYRALVGLGDVLHSSGDPHGATAAYARALALEPGFLMALERLARMLLAHEDPEAAVRCLRRGMSGKRPEEWQLLGELLLEHGLPRLAARILEEGRDRYPDDPGIQVLAAECAAWLGEPGKAVDNCRRVAGTLREERWLIRAAVVVATCSFLDDLQLVDRAAALRSLLGATLPPGVSCLLRACSRLLHEEAPQRVAFCDGADERQLANCIWGVLERLARWEQWAAFARAEKLVALLPRDEPVDDRLGKILVAAGRTAEGAQRLMAAVKAGKHDDETLVSLADLAAGMGLLEDCEVFLRAAIDRAPHRVKHYTNLVRLLVEQGRHREAMEVLGVARRALPHNELLQVSERALRAVQV